MEKYFKDLNITNWIGKTIIIDIDGTITTDASSEIDTLVSEKVKEMSFKNSVFLFSNKGLHYRDKEVANKLHIPLLETSSKKPSKKVIAGLPKNLKHAFVVIGDKVLTDGLFAKNIKAEFVKVRRLTSNEDSFITKSIYLLDDAVAQFIN